MSIAMKHGMTGAVKSEVRAAMKQIPQQGVDGRSRNIQRRREPGERT
jgi:hypothetical protein